MKESKFRCWDASEKRMLYSYIPENQHKREFTFVEFGIGFSIWDTNDLHIMQSTMLKAVKDIEIYESDILKVIAEGVHCGVYDNQCASIGALFIVKKLASGFTLVTIANKDTDIPNIATNISNYDLWNKQKWFEVVGNIFENPELLEDLK